MDCPIDKENMSLSFLFMMFLKSQNSYFKYFLKDKNITTQQIPILIKLLNHGYVYQKDISKHLKLDNAVLTRNLRKLEDNEYIERTEDNDNRRQNKISLTEKGKSVAITIREEERKREENIIKNTKYSREELIDLLLELLEHSKEYDAKQIIE